MKAHICLLFLLLSAIGANAQVVANDTIKDAAQDSIALAFEMNEIVISNVKDTISEEERKNLILLKRRTLKVFPFAKTAADRLTKQPSTWLNRYIQAFDRDKSRLPRHCH